MLVRKVFWGLCFCIISNFAGADSHHPQEFLNSIQNDPQAGKKIYQHFCSICHAKDPSIELGAPKIRIKKDWNPRMKKGLEGLLTVTKAGLNQMPPRGGCFECTDEQLKAAIIFMLPTLPKSIPKTQ